MAYSVQSMYRPAVLPDTQGLGPGIAAAGNAVAGALGTWAGWQRQDAHRQEDRAWQVEDREAAFANQAALIDKRMAGDMRMMGMERDLRREDKELERAMEETQLREANAGKAFFLQASGYDPVPLQAASKMKPKEAAAFLDAAMAQAGMKLKQQAAMEDEIMRGAVAAQAVPMIDPLTGEPHTGHFMTGNGQVVARNGFGGNGITPEQAMALGLEPASAKVGGVTYKAPTVKAPTKAGATEVPEMVKDEVTGQTSWSGHNLKLPEGYVQDPATGDLIYVGPGAGMIQRELLSRKQGPGAAAGTENRLQRLNEKLQGVR